MQRSANLPPLYETFSSIPPDIQECLLTIAQLGCSADQVKRWYAIVRHHYGIDELEPPSPIESMPPPQKPAKVPISPNRYSTAAKSPATPIHGLGLQQSSPVVARGRLQTIAPRPPLVAWPSPATSTSSRNRNESRFSSLPSPASSKLTQRELPGSQTTSPDNEMSFFTGSGLVASSRADESGILSSSISPITPNSMAPFPFDFSMSSAAIPVFAHVDRNQPEQTATDRFLSALDVIGPLNELRSSSPPNRISKAKPRRHKKAPAKTTIPQAPGSVPPVGVGITPADCEMHAAQSQSFPNSAARELDPAQQHPHPARNSTRISDAAPQQSSPRQQHSLESGADFSSAMHHHLGQTVQSPLNQDEKLDFPTFESSNHQHSLYLSPYP